ncbi:hypothetical protein ACH4ZX_40160 [Streptomyces sp. NPDC020490]|uniref:hypothetical protein n=1 Tax=Streptomyces sp. NPDC020490 TaxID=3365078 RepID=UPI0037AC1527
MKIPRSMRRFATFLPLGVGLLFLSPGTSAAADTSTEYIASNSGWAAPQTLGYVKAKCPSAYPYPKSVALKISGGRERLTNIATEKYPGETRVDFFNGNQYSNPAKYVWVDLSVTCSSVEQNPDPMIKIRKDAIVPARTLVLPGSAQSVIQCPANVPFYTGSASSTPPGVDAESSLNDEAPATVTWSFTNWTDKSVIASGYAYCLPTAP